MYTAYYGLKIKPFQISSDSKFMWLGEKHREALATLRYGILDNKGFLLLTGDVGTGKTTLINVLIGSLGNDVIYASVPDPSLDKMDFFNYIAAAFGLAGDFDSKGKFLASFSRFLHKAYENNKKVLLIIDESQLLTQELLEETRLLSNIVTKDSNPLLNIFFVGQYEFNELIRRPENRAIAQRLTLNYYIEPLTVEETGEYIRHRLKIAGTTEKIFNTSAVKLIHASSGGFPRKINIICDHCLMSGYAEEKKTITSAIVKESITELQIPERRRDQNPDSQSVDQHADSVRPVSSESLKQTSRLPFLRSIIGLLFVLVLLVSFSFVFLYYTNVRYQEAADRFLEIQEKLSFSPKSSSGKVNQAEIQVKSVLPDNKDEAKAIVAPDHQLAAQGVTSSAEKIKPTISDTTTPRERNKDVDVMSKSSENDIQAEVIQPEKTSSGVLDEQENNNVQISEVVAEKTLPVSATLTNDSAKPTAASLNLPFPDETLVIRFKYDSNVFSEEDVERMKSFAQALKDYPEAIVDITGYTDSTGDAAYNRKLSEFRASMVKSFLMGQNLPPDKIKVEGLGNENPVASNNTAQGRMLNRRVEVRAIEKNP